MECIVCKKTDESRLEKCPICHKAFCDEHGHSMSGRRFCSRYCAEFFFFSDEDD